MTREIDIEKLLEKEEL